MLTHHRSHTCWFPALSQEPMTLTSRVPSGIHEDGREPETAGRLRLASPLTVLTVPLCTKLNTSQAPPLTHREAGRTAPIGSTQHMPRAPSWGGAGVAASGAHTHCCPLPVLLQ